MDIQLLTYVGHYLLEFETIGHRMRNKMNFHLERYHKQYMVAFLTSAEELKTRHSKEVGEFYYKRFFDFISRRELNLRQRYIKLDRFLFLVNFKDEFGNDKHTEARLVDPNGDLRKEMKNHGASVGFTNEIPNTSLQIPTYGFLHYMMADFKNQRGDDEVPILVIFSHFTPCTMLEHNCSDLLKHFAMKTGIEVIVSYRSPFYRTDEQQAKRSMQCANITVIPSCFTEQLLRQYHDVLYNYGVWKRICDSYFWHSLTGNRQ